ncbi:hypothetical protein EES41_13885 [Streptomyces sp. ADI95-16]|uniref:hypothetical protein n=1 Tax=Streptomyces sp. ADI95-16 TaxID=1522758 RepID=UPI000F431F0A|nr:hypothetical protein [Streptomyces sp. ADI95-16]AYV27816.1 hypothetical protein EES41_13885 [Streptomyces sp. ADI95-16]
MSESSFQDDVLGELGPDRLTEIASLLGTDENGAKETVATTVGAMTRRPPAAGRRRRRRRQ